MKIGSVAWGWTPIPEQMPVGDSLEKIADQVKALGFEIVDYLSDFSSLDSYFTKSVSERIKKHCENLNLTIGGLVFQSSDWNQTDENKIKAQQEYFKKCVQTALDLGTSTISCIIPGPLGAKPNPASSPAEKFTSNLPKGYNWEKDWSNYIEQMTWACDYAAKHGVRIALECFPGSLCSTPHAMLQAIKDVNRENFGIQLDTAHLMNQHIDIETAIYMLGAKNIFNVHAKDSDGLTRTNLSCGTGRVDYTAVIRALKDIGYKGNISIEVEFTDNPRRYMKQALEHLKQCLEGTY